MLLLVGVPVKGVILSLRNGSKLAVENCYDEQHATAAKRINFWISTKCWIWQMKIKMEKNPKQNKNIHQWIWNIQCIYLTDFFFLFPTSTAHLVDSPATVIVQLPVESQLDGKKKFVWLKEEKKKQGFWREMTSARSESSRLLIQTTATRTNWCKITVCAHAALWWSIHCSQSCNDLTLFAVGSMWAEKANPKAARSLQSISLRLNVVQKTATTSLEMKRICCSSWACTCRRF